MDLLEKTSNEKRHPWELARARSILNIVKRYNPDIVADIGAGDRFFTTKLSGITSGAIYAVDTGYVKKSEVVNNIRCLNDVSELPELNDGKAAMILMDVLEHVRDDALFLEEALSKIPPEKMILITAPAFQFLFSDHDVFLKHHRRYSRKQLLDLARSQNLRVERCHYFYASLFFVRLAGFLFKGIRPATPPTGIGNWGFGEKHAITRLIYTVLNIDFYICTLLARLRVYLPGLSLLAICRK